MSASSSHSQGGWDHSQDSQPRTLKMTQSETAGIKLLNDGEEEETLEQKAAKKVFAPTDFVTLEIDREKSSTSGGPGSMTMHRHHMSDKELAFNREKVKRRIEKEIYNRVFQTAALQQEDELFMKMQPQSM